MLKRAKSPGSVIAALKAQARVRLLFGLPIVLGGGGWLLAHDFSPLLLAIGLVIVTYILGTFLAARFTHRIGPRRLATFTAIADPLMQSVWIAVMGEFGGLVASFYIFTILGFGFRIGVGLMRICQASAILGFCAAASLSGAFWQAHPVVWFSFLILLILVPGYAAVLIRQLHAARYDAEEASRAKSALLAKVSHELRTPLTGIVASAHLMDMELAGSPVRRRVETILGLAQDLNNEINDLLDQAKYESRSLRLEPASFDLRALLDKLHDTIEPAAQRKGLSLDVYRDPRLTDWVLGDAYLLNRALLNLGNNAVKFTPSGSVRIAAMRISETPTHYRIRFSVEDTGIGIAAKDHARVFEPFTQASAGTARKFGGTGLGMALAKEVVEAMGGKIRLQSELDHGSRFWFDIQFSRVAEPAPALPAAGHGEAAATEPRSILVVDDHETNLLLLQELLEQDHHTVVAARNGAEALAAIQEGVFDLCFFDFNLPDMDGEKLLNLYRFGKSDPAPVFFLTADATSSTRSKLEAAGAAGVLHKPVGIEALRQAVRQITRPARSGSMQPNTLGEGGMPSAAAGGHLRVVPVAYFNRDRVMELKARSRRPNFVESLLAQAAIEFDTNVGALARHLEAGDVPAVHDVAHALKGVAVNVGAVRLAALASALMSLKRTELGQAPRHIDDLEKARAGTREAIDAMLAELAGSSQQAQ
ncbi:MAG: response regulator [Proteobacteria bacterium]|nr:response regulator [Pseudomonadota bacterium]HQR03541.1 ATP-binding protein [Rhodocyclaceae bacterium]